jgi:hypothetical protein
MHLYPVWGVSGLDALIDPSFLLANEHTSRQGTVLTYLIHQLSVQALEPLFLFLTFLLIYFPMPYSSTTLVTRSRMATEKTRGSSLINLKRRAMSDPKVPYFQIRLLRFDFAALILSKCTILGTSIKSNFVDMSFSKTHQLLRQEPDRIDA